MKILRIYESSINDRFADEIASTLRDGGIIIYPTDTVYAIGCDALNSRAIERICRLKGINPDKQTLSIIAADISMASDYAKIDNHAFAALRANTPGPFTFILPASPKLPKAFKGRHTVGVRIPANAIATELAARLGHPILSTTIAAPEGEDEPLTDPHGIALQYDRQADVVIDGGEGDTLLSTVVDLTDSSNPIIIRQGKGLLQ